LTTNTATITDAALNKAFRQDVILDRLPRLVGLHGYPGTGKDAIAKILAEYGYERRAFADVLRNALYILNPIVRCDSYGREFRVKDIVDEIGWEEAKRSLDGEIRRMLQVLGTEVGRELISQDVWVNAAFKNLNPEKRYVFTDLRFENEHQALDKNLALLIKVERPGYGAVNDHRSEKPLPDRWFDVHLNNNGDLNTLHTTVHNILAQA
jgi:hypothetical protein